MVVLEAREVWKVYRCGEVECPALRGVDLAETAGEFVAIMGPSGSGKSTLLHLLGGLDTPTRGQVLVENRDLGAMSDNERTILRRTRIGFIFQSYNLLPPLTAEENVMFPLLLGTTSEREARRRAGERLAQVGLTERRGHYPSQLSGGEQQRVAVARALVTDPAVVIADEPTGALDTENGRVLMDLLTRLVDEQGQTILVVTHDPSVAARAHRIVHLRDGRVESDPAARASVTANGASPVLARQNRETP